MKTFMQKGIMNTEETCALACAKAKELNCPIVIATTKGDSVLSLLNKVEQPAQVIAVTHVQGFAKPNENELSDEVRSELLAKGVQIVTAAHALSGAERAFSKQFGGVMPVEIVAHTLRMFSQGIKVCVEIACMAADAGMIRTGTPIVVVAGSGRGADTAVVLSAATTAHLLDTCIHEILCMPYDK